jgi:toxin HigB-1
VIRSFADRETEKVFHREHSRKLPGDVQAIALRKLRMLSNAHTSSDLRRLERLVGNREGRYSVPVNDRWRLCFVWRDGDVFEAEIVDYH